MHEAIKPTAFSALDRACLVFAGAQMHREKHKQMLCRVQVLTTVRSISTGRVLLMRVEAKKGSNASKAVAKANLPSKVCIVCQRPFTW